MFKDLAPGIKISITRSISKSFEQYMAKIEWSEQTFNINDFVSEWRDYITNHASWYEKVDEETKSDSTFHEQLAEKINETIDKILTEEPTAEQMEEMEHLQRELKYEDVHYSCKTEAKFQIERLKEMLKKK